MRIKRVVLGALLLFTCGLAAAQVNSRAVGEHFALRSPVHAQQGAVATTHLACPWMSFGVLGGSFQPQGHVQILVNMIDFGMNAQEAGDAARAAVTGGAEPWDPRKARPHVILAEPGVSDAVVAELKRRGHEVKRPVGEFAFGGYQGIRRDPVTGVYEAASEMRMDGMAAGY